MLFAKDRWVWAGAGVALALGLWLRLWHVFAEPLWLDEAYSAFAADHGFGFLWQVVPRYETHPPFYYSLLHLWVLIAGDGIVALRWPGLVAGVATLVLVVLAARRIGTRLAWAARSRGRLVAAALSLASLSVPLIGISRQVRPYPFMILAYAIALVLVLLLMDRAEAERRLARPQYLAYLVVLEAMLWLHNMGPLFGAALTVALAIAIVRTGLGRRDWAWLILGHAAAALAYLPGLLILAGQAPTWIGSTWLRFQPLEAAGHVQMLYAVNGVPALLAALLALLGGLACGRSGQGRIAAMLLVLAVMPVLLSILLSITVAPVFIFRTMTPVAVPALLLVAIGGVGAPAKWRWFGVGAVLALCGALLMADVENRRRGPFEDWYATVDWLSRWSRPGDMVFAYPNEGALPLIYALRDEGLRLPVRPIPAPVPALAGPGGWYLTGSRGVVGLPPARLEAIADQPATQAVPTIWLLRLGKATYDPGDHALRALHRGRYIVRSWTAGPIDIIGLRRLPAGSVVRSLPAPARSPR